MSNKASTENPKVELADKNWVLKELMSTEHRIEKTFHEQTRFLGQKIDNNNRWMIGLVATMTIAIILAVLFKS